MASAFSVPKACPSAWVSWARRSASSTRPSRSARVYSGKQLHAVRAGRWKLHFPHAYRSLNGRPGGTGGRPVRYTPRRIDLSLFDLENDVGESTDVKGEHPDVVARLSALAERMRDELGDGDRRGRGVRPPGRLARNGR